MNKIVVDTNVVVSAHIKAKSPEDQILRRVFDQRSVLCITDPILTEYERVLNYPRLSLDPVRVGRSLDQLRRIGTRFHPPRRLSVCPDEDDNRFLECAEAAKAD